MPVLLTNKCEPDNTGIEQRGAVAFLSIAKLIHQNVDLVLLTFFTDAKIISVYTVYYLVGGNKATYADCNNWYGRVISNQESRNGQLRKALV